MNDFKLIQLMYNIGSMISKYAMSNIENLTTHDIELLEHDTSKLFYGYWILTNYSANPL